MALYISVEGGNTIGKSTQVQNLAKRLQGEGYRVKTLHFPRYDSPIGALIGKALKGHIHIDPIGLQHLYVADQVNYDNSDKLDDNNNYDVVIYDRYHLSTVVHTIASLLKNNNHVEEEDRLLIQDMIRKIRHMQEYIIIPYIQIIMHISDEEMYKRLEAKEKDLHENDKQLMSITNDLYRQATQLGLVHAGVTFNYDVTGLSIEKITDRLYNDVIRYLKI